MKRVTTRGSDARDSEPSVSDPFAVVTSGAHAPGLMSF
jgi:hypothetical protein